METCSRANDILDVSHARLSPLKSFAPLLQVKGAEDEHFLDGHVPLLMQKTTATIRFPYFSYLPSSMCQIKVIIYLKPELPCGH